MNHTISPEKDTLNQQITVSTTHINTINNPNKQSNQSHNYANKSNNTRLVYSLPRTQTEMYPLICNLTPLLVPNLRFTPL